MSLIKSYLKTKKQCTDIVHDNGYSGEKRRPNITSVKCGVPQGSVFGPFLFKCYVNDFTVSLDNRHISMYADGTSGLCWAKGYPTLRDKVLMFMNESKLLVYYEENNFMIDLDKTQLVKTC